MRLVSKSQKKIIEGSLNEGEACFNIHFETAVLLCEEWMRARCRQWKTRREAIMADWVIDDPGLGQGAHHNADTEKQRLEGS